MYMIVYTTRELFVLISKRSPYVSCAYQCLGSAAAPVLATGSGSSDWQLVLLSVREL